MFRGVETKIKNIVKEKKFENRLFVTSNFV